MGAEQGEWAMEVDAIVDVLRTALGESYRELLLGVVVGLAVATPFGIYIGRREGRRDIKRLSSALEIAEKRADVEAGNAAQMKTAADERYKALAEAHRSYGLAKLELETIAGERDRAVAHGQQVDRALARLKATFNDDVWRRPWSDERAANAEGDGGAEQALGKSAIPIIAVGNLKGGVGKTTLTGNLGAYLAQRATQSDGQIKPVLFVDLDFQGSLSQTMLLEAGAIADEDRPDALDRDYRVQHLFRPNAALEPAALLGQSHAFRSDALEGSRFFDCEYPAARLEEQLLIDWAAHDAPGYDVRLRLAEFLYSQPVQDAFGAVVLDLPPRATTFSVNALCAATDVIIPTRADDLSALAAQRFAGFLESYRTRFWPQLRLCGVVGMMIRTATPSSEEQASLEKTVRLVNERWRGADGRASLIGVVPAKASIAAEAGLSFQFFTRRDNTANPPNQIFSVLGGQVLERLSRRP